MVGDYGEDGYQLSQLYCRKENCVLVIKVVIEEGDDGRKDLYQLVRWQGYQRENSEIYRLVGSKEKVDYFFFYLLMILILQIDDYVNRSIKNQY